MRRRWAVVASLLLASGSLFRVAGVPAAAEETGSLAVARKAIEEGRGEEAIRLLRSRLEANGGNAEDSEGRYLLGLALFKHMTVELERLRAQAAQGPGVLVPEQAAALRECLAHLTKAVELSPKAKFAADAAFLAARVQDWGYLNRFEAARKSYAEVLKSYPGTDAADQAAKRLEYWDNLWKHEFATEPAPAPAPAPKAVY